jgi:hypothetical protein
LLDPDHCAALEVLCGSVRLDRLLRAHAHLRPIGEEPRQAAFHDNGNLPCLRLCGRARFNREQEFDEVIAFHIRRYGDGDVTREWDVSAIGALAPASIV